MATANPVSKGTWVGKTIAHTMKETTNRFLVPAFLQLSFEGSCVSFLGKFMMCFGAQALVFDVIL